MMTDHPTYAPSSFQRLVQTIIDHTWSVPSPLQLHLTIPFAQVYQTLDLATKPSVKRLSLRKLFGDSRRYFIRPLTDNRFQMKMTRRLGWYPRRRTDAIVLFTGEVTSLNDRVYHLTTRSHIMPRYLVSKFFLPLFFTSIIIYMDWSPLIIIALIIGLFGSTWLHQRFSALLEVHDISFFIETILTQYLAQETQQLSGEAHIVVEPSFVDEWDKFIAQHEQTDDLTNRDPDNEASRSKIPVRD